MKIKDVLERAEQVVLVDRQKEYNQVSKTEMHSRIAEAWSATLGRMVTPHEVALCMVQLKVIRAACQPGHEDSYVDMVGYASIAAEIMHEDQPIQNAEAPAPVRHCNWCSESINEAIVSWVGGRPWHPSCLVQMRTGSYAEAEVTS